MTPWHFVDQAYAITLDTAVHRHPRLQQELQRVQLADKTHVMKVKRHPEGGVKGCYESHRAAWLDGLAKGHEVILVLEDDVFFSDDWKQHVEHVADFVLHSGQPWHTIALGWTPFRSHPHSPHMSLIRRGTATHAYLVSRAALVKGLPPFNKRAVDVELWFAGRNRAPKFKKHLRKHTNDWTAFALQPMIAFQRYDRTTSTGNSDIANQFKERVGVMRFFGFIADYSDVPCFVRVSCFVGLIVLVLTILVIILSVQRKRQSLTALV